MTVEDSNNIHIRLEVANDQCVCNIGPTKDVIILLGLSSLVQFVAPVIMLWL